MLVYQRVDGSKTPHSPPLVIPIPSPRRLLRQQGCRHVGALTEAHAGVEAAGHAAFAQRLLRQRGGNELAKRNDR